MCDEVQVGGGFGVMTLIGISNRTFKNKIVVTRFSRECMFVTVTFGELKTGFELWVRGFKMYGEK